MAKARKNKKRPSSVVRIGEEATPERHHQLGGVITEVIDRDDNSKRKARRDRARNECMPDFYHNENTMSDPQHKAALKYREIYLTAFHGYNCKILCSPFLIDSGKADPEGKMLAHIHCTRLLHEAQERLTEEERSIVRDVCAYDHSALTRKRKRILLRALDALADFWGYK
jgi:hypothetical protein